MTDFPADRAWIAAELARCDGVAPAPWDVDEGDFTLYSDGEEAGTFRGTRVIVDSLQGIFDSDFTRQEDERHMRWIAAARTALPYALTLLAAWVGVVEAISKVDLRNLQAMANANGPLDIADDLLIDDAIAALDALLAQEPDGRGGLAAERDC